LAFDLNIAKSLVQLHSKFTSCAYYSCAASV
jgi:hypothetical protein